MAWIYNHFGMIGLKLMKLACSAGVVLFLIEGMTEAGSAPILQFVVMTCAVVSLAPQVQFRPQLFTFLLLSGLLTSLAKFNYRGNARLWLAIPMLALWAKVFSERRTVISDVIEGKTTKRLLAGQTRGNLRPVLTVIITTQNTNISRDIDNIRL